MYIYTLLTYGSSGSPADLSLYLLNSGVGQGHSAQSASSGTRGLWVNDAEAKVIKHLEDHNKSQTHCVLSLVFNVESSLYACSSFYYLYLDYCDLHPLCKNTSHACSHH